MSLFLWVFIGVIHRVRVNLSRSNQAAIFCAWWVQSFDKSLELDGANPWTLVAQVIVTQVSFRALVRFQWFPRTAKLNWLK